MLTVTNGFKLYTSEPSSHDYHFQAMPSPITRTITAPYDPNDNPPYLINDMGELIMKCDAYDSSTLPVAEDCKITSFSFRTLSEPTRVQTISSAKGHPAYPNVYMPTVNGNWNTNTIGSWTPIKYCIYGFVQDAHINADGTIFYTVGSIYQAASFLVT